MTQDVPIIEAPISRRQLLAVGAVASVAAVGGMAIAGKVGSPNAKTPPTKTNSLAAPTSTAESTSVATESVVPTAVPTDEDGVIGFETDPDESTPADDAATEPAETQVSEDASTPSAAAVDPASVLEEITIAKLREYLDGGAFTIAELVTATLARIEQYDEGDIALNAIITLNPDAASIAADLDAELAAGQSRGPLHGIPVLLKDIIATGDKMPNTAGSLALQDNIANADSFAAKLLRDAGAVILGKTNLTEFSNYAGGNQTSGLSSLGGITCNPYNLNKSASGSSTGSAVAVAASYTPLAIGAEFDGSIIAPAAQCGVVGVKPTVGLVGRSGVIPISITFDSLGPMARTVTDAAIALEVIAGIDPGDPGRTVGASTAPWAAFDSDPTPEAGKGDYTSALTPDALKGKKIGAATSLIALDDASQALFLQAVELIKQAGADVSDVSINVEPLEKGLRGACTVPEMAWGLKAYLDTFTPDGPMKTIEDLAAFHEQHADEMPDTDFTGITDCLGAASLNDQSYIDATQTIVTSTRSNGLDASMDGPRIDAFIAVTASVPVDLWNHQGFGSSSNLSSLAGYPAVTIPIGLVDDLPIGLCFFGRAYSEAQLLAFAYALEQLLPARAVPTYIPRTT